MKKLISIIIIIIFIPIICLAEAGNHAKSERLKELYNKVYPKTKTIGHSTFKRYKDSKVYYNRDKHPTGPPKYVRKIGDYQLYRREARKELIRQLNRK